MGNREREREREDGQETDGGWRREWKRMTTNVTVFVESLQELLESWWSLGNASYATVCKLVDWEDS